MNCRNEQRTKRPLSILSTQALIIKPPTNDIGTLGPLMKMRIPQCLRFSETPDVQPPLCHHKIVLVREGGQHVIDSLAVLKCVSCILSHLSFIFKRTPSHVPMRTLANQVASVARKISRGRARFHTDPSLECKNAAGPTSPSHCRCCGVTATDTQIKGHGLSNKKATAIQSFNLVSPLIFTHVLFKPCTLPVLYYV